MFIHDPLYQWSLKPLDILQEGREYQDNDHTRQNVQRSGGASAECKMALLKVQHKLQGLESDGALSIEGQVKKLMTDAQDPQLLSQMYPGWGAWI